MGEGQGSWGGRLAAGLGGCAVGVVAMVALGAAIAPSPGEATPNRVVVQPEAWPVEQQMVPCAVRMDAARAWGESASGELAALEFSEKLLRGQLGPMGGLPSPWPASVPDGEREAAVRVALAAAAEQTTGLEMVDVDCSEYPCIASATLAEASTGQLGQWVREAGLDSKFSSVSGARGEGDSIHSFGTVVLGGLLDDEIAERAKVRSERILEAGDAD